LEVSEIALAFPCQEASLVGILHGPNDPLSVGVVIVVGGPQYRVGSHRQFVHLARSLASQGVAVFRFDCRGMGDSEGDFPGFEAIDADIQSAIDHFMRQVPSLEQVVIWGLCDGASAASFYAPGDSRVKGVVLVNPWVRTGQGEAKAYIKHYYLQRFFSAVFWRKVLAGKFNVLGSLRSLKYLLTKSAAKQPWEMTAGPSPERHSAPLPERVFNGLQAFKGQVLLIISGQDLTAAEFMDAVEQSAKRKRLLSSKRFLRKEIGEADHTFSRDKWKKEAAQIALDWLKTI